jgi:arginyl-tRNA synthetase
MTIQQKLQQATAKAIANLYQQSIQPADIQVQETRKEFAGDYTIVVFPLLKLSKKNPQQTAEELGNYLAENISDITSYEIVKGFLNLSLSDGFWMEFLRSLTFERADFWEQTNDVKNIMVEYSSPNTNKPLHLGHIRNNLLGYSVAEILKARGHKVLKANLVNDRGIHICKSMLAWMKFGNGETPESTGMKGDHLVGKYYVEFDKEYKKQIKELEAQGITKADAEKQAPIILEAQEMLRKWEANDPHTRHVWEMMNQWVYDGFAVTYKALGVDFDRYYYESQTYLLGKDIVNDGLANGAFYKRDDGSVWIDLRDEGLDEKLVLRSDGTSVYITQDMGTAQQRFDEYHLDKLIYTVGNEQDYHFKVLRLIFKKFGRAWYDSLYHLSYGMVELPEGKMKSREGTVVDADDLIEEMLSTSEQQTRELGKIEGLSEQEQSELFRKIGMAALKFFILKTDPKKTMLFDPKESIDFQGFTGPFVQYTYARVRSIMRKADANVSAFKETGHEIFPEEKEVLQLLYKKNEIIRNAEAELSPALLANYAYDLAKTYNKFYHERSVLSEPDENIRHFRLLLSHQTAETIKHCMNLLGIEMPEKM